MNLKWDHTVQYVNHLEAAEAIFSKYGLTSQFGGRHLSEGTFNSLSYFGLTYLEFLAIENRQEVATSSQLICHDALNYLPEHENFSRVALRTQNIEKVEEHLKNYNLQLSPIFNSSRKTATGELLKWKLLTIDGSFNGLPYPFIISWETSDSERLNFLEKANLLNLHQLTNVEIAEAVFHVIEPENTVKHWHELFHLPIIGNAQLAIDQQIFTFKKSASEENSLKELRFRTDPKTEFDFMIGEARYCTT